MATAYTNKMAKEDPNTRHLHIHLMSEKEEVEREDKQNLESRYGSRKAKILFTVFIYLVFIFQGINDNLLGPSLIDLEYLTNSTTSSIATIFTWRYGGYFLGTIIYGPIIDRFNEFLIIGGALSLLATATFLTPTWRHLLGLSLTTGAAGIATSCNNVCTSATILAIWGQDAKPYQQALHFFRTFGWTLSPQLIKPFLRLTTREEDNDDFTNDTMNNLTYWNDNGTMVHLRIINNSLISQHKLSPESHIQYSYIIVASCLMALSLSSIFIVIRRGCRLQKTSSKESSTQGGKSVVEGKPRVIILILLFCQAFMYGGIELAFTSLTMTFGVKYLKMSKSLGSDISTLFMAMVATSRGSCVVLSKVIQPSKLLAIQLVILLGGTLTIAFAVKLHWIVPWIAFGAAGLGTGSLFPTLINWAHSYMTVTGKETAIIFSGVAFTAMTVPPFIGFLFERIDPMWFAYIILILIGLFILLFLANTLFVRSLLKNNKQKSRAYD